MKSLPIIASGQCAPKAEKIHPKKLKPRAKAPGGKSKSAKGRLLWIGDAVVPTGFATVTHNVLQHLHERWDVTVSGVNYDGVRHCHPYTILPAWQGGDMWGMNRFADLCSEFAPDVVLINSDWWNVAGFLQCAPHGLPMVAYMPVDGLNLNRTTVARLNRLAAAAWYSDFGWREAMNSGFQGARHVVPHGIDTALFRPVDKAHSRKALGLPQKSFLVGNVNRNQPRKRLDLTLHYFAEWIRTQSIRDAWLVLHCAKRDTGWDLESLAAHHGIADRVIFTGSEEIRDGIAPEKLPLVYSALDIQVSTTLGEGWGLTTMEGMACGVPQIVPDWAALGEWATPAAKIPCSNQFAHPEINTIGAVPDKQPFIQALNALYRDGGRRREMSERGLRHVRLRKFLWQVAAGQLETLCEEAIQVQSHCLIHG